MANSASDARHSEAEIRQRLIEQNLIYAMLTLPSNMFYTVSLPATLWFFEKDKTDHRILFIDARNVFTQVDRAHREFSPEQISNLAIISQLHRGRSDRFFALIDRYLQEGKEKQQQNPAQAEVFFAHARWLKERFPEGVYQDVTGLCKLATLEEIKEQDYSLNPGRYVGVVIEEDGKT